MAAPPSFGGASQVSVTCPSPGAAWVIDGASGAVGAGTVNVV